jgi:short-subunit dehydrogenase involved in D-alanine esterification of teichoic acids
MPQALPALQSRDKHEFTFERGGLITGGNSGIGAVYADRLARRGPDLILVARDLKELDEVANRIRNNTGASVTTLVADPTNQADLAWIEQALRTNEVFLCRHMASHLDISTSQPRMGDLRQEEKNAHEKEKGKESQEAQDTGTHEASYRQRL